MSATMNAAVFHRKGQPLSLERVPRPEPGSGEVVVRVAACGFCRTDLHYMDHGVPTAKPPPLILGHEISGTVFEVAADVVGWAPGDRLLVPPVLPCGRCTFCRSGRENICSALRMLGNHVDGGFAEYVVAPARDLIPLPADVDLVKGSIIADALSTPFHAIVNRAQVREGEWVAIVGCGGVGINAVQFARTAGAHTIAIDLREEKLEVARRLGVTETIRVGEGVDVGREVRRLTGGGADVAVEAVGSPATVGMAIASIRRGGRVCLIGYGDQPTPIPTNRVMFFEYTILGSLGCRAVDYPRIIELIRRGRIALEPVVSAVLPLEEVNEAAGTLRRGEGMRTVVRP